MKIVGVVPAKGSSERLPSKNLKILGGEHLFRRKLLQLLDCALIDEVWLDTESDEIIALADDLPIKVLRRDPSLATNAADGHAMFANECRHIGPADIVVQALCTAPFVSAATIDRALRQLLETPDRDSLVATYTRKQYVWRDGAPSYLVDGRIPNSIMLPPTQIEAMSLYAVRASAKGFPSSRIGHAPLAFELTAEESLDIDDLGDFELAQKVADAEILREAQRFRVLKLGLTSSALSDILKDLNVKAVLPQPIKPMSPGKFLGRAKTLKLCGLPTPATGRTDDWKGIYKALGSYDFIRSGDVIVVATDVKEHAYFGALNAHLAIRSGAEGVVVDGMTRDIESVRGFGFPVYARGTWCNDIKYEGTVEDMNKPVEIGECRIHNGDIIFGDDDGVVCVPARLWPQVLKKTLDTLKTETAIRIDAMLGTPVREILREQGEF